MQRRSPENIHPTAPRFNLQNGIIEFDWLERNNTRQPAPRMVAYRTQPETLFFREQFMQERLVLGRHANTHKQHDIFEVPRESRPLEIEANSIGTGELAFADAEMVRELGKLSGSISRLSGGKVIGGGAAEKAFALVDYVAVGERQLYILPGSEQLLRDPHVGSLQDQMNEFSKDFNTRFGAHADDFILGYHEGFRGVV